MDHETPRQQWTSQHVSSPEERVAIDGLEALCQSYAGAWRQTPPW